MRKIQNLKSKIQTWNLLLYTLLGFWIFSFGFTASADSTAPTCSFNRLAFDISTNNQPIISGEATDTESEISQVQWRVDGGSFATARLSGFSADRKTATFTFESSAVDRDTTPHVYEVRATDAAGITATTFTSYSVYVIGDRPELGLNINGRTTYNGDIILAAPSFEVTVIVAPTRTLNTIYYTLDGNARQTLTGINPDNAKITYAFLSPTTLSDGLHKIIYEVVDSAGSVSTLEANNLVVQAAVETSVQGVALNFPNPFNPETSSTSIGYTLSKAANINLTIHDLMGNQLVKQTYFINTNGGRVGYNEVTWNGRSDSGDMVGNGIYIYLIIADGKPIGRGKITVLKK